MWDKSIETSIEEIWIDHQILLLIKPKMPAKPRWLILVLNKKKGRKGKHKIPKWSFWKSSIYLIFCPFKEKHEHHYTNDHISKGWQLARSNFPFLSHFAHTCIHPSDQNQIGFHFHLSPSTYYREAKQEKNSVLDLAIDCGLIHGSISFWHHAT